MAYTLLQDMVAVPAKFATYVIDKTTEKSALVRSGIFSSDEVVRRLIDGSPAGGNAIQVPMYADLDASQQAPIFGEEELQPEGISTKSFFATLLLRHNAWGASFLSAVAGGDDPVAAIADRVASYWVRQENKTVQSILNGILDKSSGCLNSHVLDITEDENIDYLCVDSTLTAKQKLGDMADNLSAIFMHSATFTSLQKQQQIETEYDSDLKVNINRYLGYFVYVDDSLPVTPAQSENPAKYTTYLIGNGAFIREEGTPPFFEPAAFVKDELKGYKAIVSRRAMVIHPRGLSFDTTGLTKAYASNAELATPAKWTATVDTKKIPIVAIQHILKEDHASE